MISKRITIIGAGLSGSLLAILLSKEGYEVEMYERREDLRNGNITGGRSINLALSHRGIKALEQIGIMDEINKIVVPVTGRIIHNINGEISYQPYGKDKTEFNLSISRADLNIKLLDFAEKNNVKIYFNHNCRKYTPKTNELMIENDSDGTKLQLFPDVIIGTDGSSSAIRKSIINLGRFNYSQTYLDHGYKELEIPAGPDNSFRMDKNGLHIWPRGEFMLIALPNTDGSFTCTLFFPHNGDISFDSLTTPEKVNQLFNEYFPDVIDKMPNLTSEFFINPTGRLLTIKSDPWYYEDKLILLGDASHAIVPFYGQGMNSAFEDCMSLIHHLKEYRGDWDQIFKEVYKDRKPNTDAIAQLSLDNYLEMRNSVANEQFLLRKKAENMLYEAYPKEIVSKYSMVTYHPEIPYAEAYRKGKILENILHKIFTEIDTIEEFDLEEARRKILFEYNNSTA